MVLLLADKARPMSDRIKRTRVTEVAAECQGCEWTGTDAGALGRAAQHHDATGHEVHIEQTLLVIYGEGPTPEELGQTVFDDLGEGKAPACPSSSES